MPPKVLERKWALLTFSSWQVLSSGLIGVWDQARISYNWVEFAFQIIPLRWAVSGLFVNHLESHHQDRGLCSWCLPLISCKLATYAGGYGWAEELSKGMVGLRTVQGAEMKWENKPAHKDQACLCLICLKNHKFSSGNGKKHPGARGGNCVWHKQQVTTVSWVLGWEPLVPAVTRSKNFSTSEWAWGLMAAVGHVQQSQSHCCFWKFCPALSLPNWVLILPSQPFLLGCYITCHSGVLVEPQQSLIKITWCLSLLS